MRDVFKGLLDDVGKFSIPPGESIILVVDDEHAIVSTLERFLVKKGYIVLTAMSAEEAIDILGTDYLPHVVLTDKNLPGEDGLEIIRQGKILSPFTEFILMTGYATIESSIEAMDLGAVGYIQKPFDLRKVLEKVKSALDKNLTQHQQRILVERLKNVYENQASVAQELDDIKAFVDTKVRELLADLGSQFQDVETSLQTIQQLSSAIVPAEQDNSEAKKAVQNALDGWQRATLTVHSFVKTHQRLAQAPPE